MTTPASSPQLQQEDRPLGEGAPDSTPRKAVSTGTGVDFWIAAICVLGPLWQSACAFAAGYTGRPAWIVYSLPPACLLMPAGFAMLLIVPIATVIRRKTLTRKQSVLRWSLVALLLAVFVARLGFVKPHQLGLRTKVREIGGISRLQTWAVSTMATPAGELQTHEGGNLVVEQLPKCIRDLNPRAVWIMEDREPKDRHVVVLTAGGGLEPGWGLLLGSLDFVTESTRSRRVVKWQDGAYYFWNRD